MIRNWMIQVRTTKDEMDELRTLARSTGFITVSGYVRHCCFERPFWVQGKLVEMGDVLEEIKTLLVKKKRISTKARTTKPGRE